MKVKKDYCTCFPDVFKGIDISGACKKHDRMCGERGTYLFFDTIKPFYNSLRECGIGHFWATIITTGGTMIYGFKFPYFCYKKYKYRKKLKGNLT